MLGSAGEFLCHLGVIRCLREGGQRQRPKRGIDSGSHGLKAAPQIKGSSTAVGRHPITAGGDSWSAGRNAALKQRGGGEAWHYRLLSGMSR
jgi:hypothetical protein